MLLPRIFRIIGWILLLPALFFCARVQFGHYVISFLDFNKHPRGVSIFEGLNRRHDYSDEVTTTALILILLFIAFGRLRNESPLTGKIRLFAFYWSAVITWAGTALYLVIMSLPKFGSIESRWFDFISQGASYLILNNFLVPIALFNPVFYYLRRKIKLEEQLKPLYLLSYTPFNLVGKAATLLFMLFAIVTEMFSTKYSMNSDVILFFPMAIALWTCSKERLENAGIFILRLKAIRISLLIHYGLFIITYWLIYGWDYFDAFACSVVSLQLIFLLVFSWLKHKASKPTG